MITNSNTAAMDGKPIVGEAIVSMAAVLNRYFTTTGDDVIWK